jgi:GntR family transcriptional regulator
MRITIDVNAESPVFTQLMEQIRSGVQGGDLKPGSALPAIRQLAADLQINPNTVAKAYALLERDGVIETRGRAGSFVHREGRRHARVNLAAQAVTVLTDAIARLRDAGLTDSEIRNAFSGVMRD